MKWTTRVERQAALMERERLRIERTAIAKVAAFGLRVRLAAIKAYRDKTRISDVIDAEVSQLMPVIVEAMTAAHLMGRLRSDRLAKRSGALFDAPLMLDISNLYRDAIAFAKLRLGLSDAAVARIAELYSHEAATVTGSMATELETKVQKAIVSATNQGLHVRDGTKLIKKAFDAAGVTPANSYTVENIFRTQTALAYGAGRANANAAPEIQQILWGYQYSAIHDDRTRPAHAAMDGVRAPKDDPIWQVWTPPAGFSCRCSLIEIYHTDTRLTKPTAIPTTTTDQYGNEIPVQPDPGWDFNPGNLFRDSLISTLAG